MRAPAGSQAGQPKQYRPNAHTLAHGSVVEVEASALARLTPSLLAFPAGPSDCVFGTFVALLLVAHAEVAA
jgi:hypothetical protein